MSLRPSLNPAVVRLVPGGLPAMPADSPEPARKKPIYKPLIAGPAILRRHDGKWLVSVSTDGLLRPLVPGSTTAVRQLIGRQRRAGVLCRVGLALVSPEDLQHLAADDHRESTDEPGQSRSSSGRLRLEIYGWSLMIQLPGISGIAVVDAHEAVDDLPAFYESPLELVDRANHLGTRGVPSRPIALVTRPEDFERRVDGGVRNRFHPQTRFRRPCRLQRLL